MSSILALDFVNTVTVDRSGPVDRLEDHESLTVWARAHARDLGIDPAGFAATPELRDDVVALRQAVRALFAHAVSPHPPSSADAARLPAFEPALDLVNATAAAVPVVPRLVWPADEAPRVLTLPARAAGDSARLRAALAVAAIDLLDGPHHEEIRTCPAPRCVHYFVRNHPRQEWCSVGCGNRARAARHYRQHKAH